MFLKKVFTPLNAVMMLTVTVGCTQVSAAYKEDVQQVDISVLSSRPDMVSAGSALISVAVPEGVKDSAVKVFLGDRDISSHFKSKGSSLIGLVSGLQLGKNMLSVNIDGAVKSLVLVNHDRSGPIISGPHQVPFICETHKFMLPDRSKLGLAEDENCNIPTQITYVYKAKGSQDFKVLPSQDKLPIDVSTTTTTEGNIVNYIVRVETGTVNRAIYQHAVLFDPTKKSELSPSADYKGWNRKIVYSFGGGASSGYHQGVFLGGAAGVLESDMLSRGFAVLASTLNVNTNVANDVVSAETASMVKEKFIKTFGKPIYTMGWGLSGGSMQQHLIANNYPGILDGITPENSFPDLHSLVPPTMDCALLQKAFNSGKQIWTEEQKTVVSGHNTWETCKQWLPLYSPHWMQAKQSNNALIPVTGDFLSDTNNCSVSLKRELTYDPKNNPEGARCDIYSAIRNLVGVDPETGFAARGYDNVGIQYGLGAYQAGKISEEHFVELNEKAGGFDGDGNFQKGRTIASPLALKNLYAYGRINQGENLAQIPMIDYRADSGKNPNVHDNTRSVIMKARLIRSNGHADNQVIIRYGDLLYGSPDWKAMELSVFLKMDAWLSKIKSDKTLYPNMAAKVVANKPEHVTDACFTSMNESINEPGDFKNGGKCGKLMPYSLDPRMVAGAPLTDDVLKCQLQPLLATDYPRFSLAQIERMKAVFPSGVCDFSKPGVGSTSLKATWLSYPKPGVAEPLE